VLPPNAASVLAVPPPLPPEDEPDAAATDSFWGGDAPAWLVSLFVHLVGLLAIAYITIPPPPGQRQPVVLTVTPVVEHIEPLVAEQFEIDTTLTDDVGAMSFDGDAMALSEAPELADISQSPAPVVPVADFGPLQLADPVALATGLHLNKNYFVKGAAGVGTTGAAGAIDQLTQEIMMSLDERETLVVWLFDQSASLIRQRQTIHDRLGRIYDELGVIEQSGHNSFRKHGGQPLLTSVIAFGSSVNLLNKKPIADIAEIKELVQGISRDDTGIENVFQAIGLAADHFKAMRSRSSSTGKPKRNVMLIAFTDEVGDDQMLLDKTVEICRRFEMPVYVVGIPAPFGRKEALVKWVDPDPNYDQTPTQGEVDQGPESLFPERLKLHAADGSNEMELIDSGFGPYALTRLCYETGGIYFAVHPNRDATRRIRWRDVEAFSSHLTHFFDPQVMRKYQPDYVSIQEYQRRVQSNRARQALVTASRESWLTPMATPDLRFVKRSEAQLATELTTAQQAAAKLEPSIEKFYQVLKQGEDDRLKEDSLRWQAGYDLAMGQTLAMKVRTESYNAMLAMAKQGLNFSNQQNNTWQLAPADEIKVGSQLDNLAKRARLYLERVVEEHPDTPWALLAQNELNRPLGWQWNESYTNLDPPRVANNGGDNNAQTPPSDDQRRMIERPKPRRPVPKL
jgi:hypothetical protein